MDSQTDGNESVDDLKTQNSDGGDGEDLEDDPSGTQNDSSDGGSTDGDDADADAELDTLFQDVDDLRDFRDRTSRALGRVASNQREIAELRTNAVDPADVADLREQNNAMLDMLAELAPDDPRLDAMRKNRDDSKMRREVKDKVAEAVGEGAPPKQEISGPATDGPWGQANAVVHAYAQGKGVDANKIPEATWDAAQATNDPASAQRLLMAEVDKMADTDTGGNNRRQRRSDRKAAGANDKTVERGGNAGSGLTMEALQGMTQEQILALDQDEVNRVISGG
jgi:hypothetical protein